VNGDKVLWGCGSLLVAGVVGLLLVLFSGAQVNAGNVGVVSSFGAVDPNQQPLGQGFHVVMPFTTHIQSVSIQPQSYTFKEVGAASKELQNVYVDGSVNYHINSSDAASLTIKGGPQYIVGVVFDPAFQDYVKTIVPTYAVEDILPNRDTIRNAVKSRLSDKAAPYGIVVDDVFITNIHFDADYTKAIEAKQVAAQQLEQAKIQAQTAVQTAQGVADAQVVQATADAKANQLREQGLTPELIQYLEIQKWNGVLPTTVGTGGIFTTITH
jgi:prohibitin 1